MEESKRIELINLATEDIFLRYPKYNLNINYTNEWGKVSMETFIKDKKSNRLMYIMDSYKFDKPFDFEVLIRFKDRFLSMCKINESKYIFNKDTAIQEPYEINNL